MDSSSNNNNNDDDNNNNNKTTYETWTLFAFINSITPTIVIHTWCVQMYTKIKYLDENGNSRVSFIVWMYNMQTIYMLKTLNNVLYPNIK